jgi:hypothetical protein
VEHQPADGVEDRAYTVTPSSEPPTIRTSSPAAEASGPPHTPQSTTVTPQAAPPARISSTVSVGMVLVAATVVPPGGARWPRGTSIGHRHRQAGAAEGGGEIAAHSFSLCGTRSNLLIDRPQLRRHPAKHGELDKCLDDSLSE